MANIVCDGDIVVGAFSEFVSLGFHPAVLNDPAAALADTTALILGAEALDAAQLADTVTPNAFTLVAETPVWSEVTTPTVQARVAAQETARFADALTPGLRRDIVEVGTLADEAPARRAADIYEVPSAADATFPSTANAALTALEVGRFADVLEASKRLDTAETAALADTAVVGSGAARDIAETGDFSTAAFVSVPLKADIVERPASVQALLARATIRVTALEAGADLEGFALLPGSAWTSNTDSWAASRYDPYEFREIVSVGGRLFALGPAGVAHLSGGDDAGAPIGARLDTGLSELKEPRLKLAQALYLGYSSESPLTVTIGVTADGSERLYAYTAAPRAADAFTAGRIPVGRGLRSRYMRVVLENTAGGDFAIDEAALEVDVSARRI